MKTKNIFSVAMGVEEFLRRNQKNGQKKPRWGTYHTFYKT
jgi:hypothetical protein